MCGVLTFMCFIRRFAQFFMVSGWCVWQQGYYKRIQIETDFLLAYPLLEQGCSVHNPSYPLVSQIRSLFKLGIRHIF